ncbi:YIP1 family protein [Candidatus Woesearchaeota archaeon]|nr:YIP1 family protein [Candidatus Woesearchaeota archaeon]
MNIFKVIQKVLTEPASFFERVGKGDNHLDFAFGYFAALSLFATVMSAIISLILFFLIAPSLLAMPVFGPIISAAMTKFSVSKVFFNSIWTYILGLGLIFAMAGIVHAWILIFRGKNKYAKTFELVVYARTPTLILGWIPLVSFAAWIWSFILLVLGTEKVHSISRTKAILMYVIPTIISLIIITIVWFLLAPLFLTKLSPLFGGVN